MPVMLSGIEPAKSTETPVRIESAALGDESAFGNLMRGMLAQDEPSFSSRDPAPKVKAGRHNLPLELGLSAEDSGTENPETPPDDPAVDAAAARTVPEGNPPDQPQNEEANTPPLPAESFQTSAVFPQTASRATVGVFVTPMPSQSAGPMTRPAPVPDAQGKAEAPPTPAPAQLDRAPAPPVRAPESQPQPTEHNPRTPMPEPATEWSRAPAPTPAPALAPAPTPAPTPGPTPDPAPPSEPAASAPVLSSSPEQAESEALESAPERSAPLEAKAPAAAPEKNQRQESQPPPPAPLKAAASRESAAGAKETPSMRQEAPVDDSKKDLPDPVSREVPVRSREPVRAEQAGKPASAAAEKVESLLAQAADEDNRIVRRSRGARVPAQGGPAVRGKPASNGTAEPKAIEEREAAESARTVRDLSATEQPSAEARTAPDAAIVNHPIPGQEREPKAPLAQGFQWGRAFAPPPSAASFQRGISQAPFAPMNPNEATIERIHELMDRFDEHVLSLASGKDKTMTITLVPDNLGKVVLSCRENGARMSVEIVAENHAVRNLIQEQESGLRQALEQQGYKMDAFDVKTRGDDAGARSFDRRAPERERDEEASRSWRGRPQGASLESADSEPRSAWMPAGSGGLWVVA